MSCKPSEENLTPEPQVQAHFNVEGDAPGMPAWAEIKEGRFMPRRVRGSCHGRALG